MDTPFIRTLSDCRPAMPETAPVVSALEAGLSPDDDLAVLEIAPTGKEAYPYLPLSTG